MGLSWFPAPDDHDNPARAELMSPDQPRDDIDSARAGAKAAGAEAGCDGWDVSAWDRAEGVRWPEVVRRPEE
ncbi:hypothetical protein BN12_660020 [Nostocoides japonicum T1-X7]|uniref:Uncharacterized protein n=1 Tax=Nostocoides japonicum T1-X7 TaxID=1194083 RepID=A0A077M713_9MICO|nr:hypothetical protein BN12_660020 [Tetrasphaera japonica T1-X7]